MVQGAATFGKANGLGDIEAEGIVPPIEIGNLVWSDADRDGIQDGDEPGIPGVMVELLDDQGNFVAMDVTDADGGYYFNFSNVNAPDGPDPLTSYTIRIKPDQFNNGEGQGVLAGYLLTSTDESGNGEPDKSDNDASLVGGLAQLSMMTGANGQNNHSYDFGFTPCELTTAGLDVNSITCHDGGTPNGVTTDDYISFTLTPEGINIHNPYTVEVVGGGTTITPTSANFGVTTEFELGPGSADGNTAWIIRITDGDDPDCTIDVQVGPIDNCSENCNLVLNPFPVCQTGANLYDLHVEYIYANDLADNLTIELGTGESQTVAITPSNGVDTVIFTGLSNVGVLDIDVTGSFANNTFCAADTSYDAPESCCTVTIDDIQVSDCFQGTYQVDITATFAGFNGNILIELNNEQYSFTPAASAGTETFTISGLECVMTGNFEVTVFVYNEDIPDCNDGGDIGSQYMIPLLVADLGDLPNTYGTTIASSGAIHTMTPLLYLGSCVDNELDGQPNLLAGTILEGDDNGGALSTTYGTCAEPEDDEDGLIMATQVFRGSTIQLVLSGINEYGENAFLTAWIDWNGNGTLEPGEQVVSETIPSGGGFFQAFSVTVPDDAALDQDLGVRVRLNLNGAAAPTGLAVGGEVEDYILRVTCPGGPCLPSQINR